MNDGPTPTEPGPGGRWLDVGGVDEVARRKRFVVTDGDDEIVVIAHGGAVYAMANHCIHRQRELVKGVVLRDRLVCPGHQWAFALDTGWESVKQECQPTYTVRATDAARIELDLDSRAVRVAPPADAQPVSGAEPVAEASG